MLDQEHFYDLTFQFRHQPPITFAGIRGDNLLKESRILMDQNPTTPISITPAAEPTEFDRLFGI